MTLRRCMHCYGSGWDSPPRENRRKCRECGGEGQVPESHAWAGWELSLDFCAHNHTCPLQQRKAAA